MFVLVMMIVFVLVMMHGIMVVFLSRLVSMIMGTAPYVGKQVFVIVQILNPTVIRLGFTVQRRNIGFDIQHRGLIKGVYRTDEKSAALNSFQPDNAQTDRNGAFG